MFGAPKKTEEVKPSAAPTGLFGAAPKKVEEVKPSPAPTALFGGATTYSGPMFGATKEAVKPA
jgi:hypothetical protein